MDENMSTQNYNTLKEMVLDENKLVTYVSISKDLCIHVNESKRLLSQLVDHIKSSESDIAIKVNYIISGLREDKNALTTVCSETEIDNVKKALKTVFFEHVYSVRKGSSIVDNVALLSVNKFEDFSLCSGLIKGNMCVKHSVDEISSLKSNSQEIVVSDPKIVTSQSKNKEVKKENSKTVNGQTNLNHKTSNNGTKEVTIKTEATSPKTDKKVINKPNKGIAGFFSKSNGVAPKKSRNDESTSLPSVVKADKDEKHIETKIPEKPVKVKEEKMEVQKKESPPSKSENTSKISESKSKNKSLNNIKKNAKVDKKRKRVLQVSDSDSDDEKNDPFADSTPVSKPAYESDDEIPPTPTVNTVKITSGIVNPKKRRKIVDKTYTDEDGYILTKKEEVYESCSDNEMEVDTKENNQHVNQVKLEVSPSKKPMVEVSPSKKQKVEVSPSKKQNGTKNGRKKVSPPQKGKQATLMSFFKKV